MAYERLRIPLARLRLNKENDRHGSLASEPDCISWMLDNLGDEIRNLAQDIAERGLSPIDGVLVLPDPEMPGDYIVWEGNRRITALKLIDDSNRCSDVKLRREFGEIRGKAKVPVPDEIECTVAPSVEEADYLIELRHQGPQEGVGTLQWDGQQKSRHLQRRGKKGRYAFSHQIVDTFSDKLDSDLREKVVGSGFAISTLDRLLKNPDVRDFLGIASEDGAPRRFLHEKETLKGLKKMLSDIAEGMPVRKIYTAAQQRDYIRGFPVEDKPDRTKKLKDSVAVIPSAQVLPKPPAVRSKPISFKRPHLIPSDVHYAIKDKRLNSIYRELRELNLKDYRNSAAVLFRVFVELSIELYLDKQTVSYSENDNLSKKAEKAVGHMEAQRWADRQTVKGIKAAISSPHNPLSFNTFNSYVHNRLFHPAPPELATAWDNVQPFLDVLFEHLN